MTRLVGFDRNAKTGRLQTGKTWPGRMKISPQAADGRVRIWDQQNESMDPTCRVSTVQAAAGGVTV